MSGSPRSDRGTPRAGKRPASPARRRLLQAGSALGLGLAAAPLLGGSAAQAMGLADLGAPPMRQSANTVEFWSRETADNGARQPLINAHLAAFDSANGTRSSAQFMVFQESIQKTQAAIAAGSPPDLGQQGPDVTMQFAAAGHLLPIDDVSAQIAPTLAPLQRDAFVSLGGQAYSVPWYIETRVLFYHKDLLDAAGLKPPTTWAEWTETAKALTTPDQFGFVVPMEGTNPGQLWVPLGISNGGLVIDGAGSVMVNSAEMKESLKFCSDFLLTHKTMDEAALTYKATDLIQLFMLKKIAMVVANGELARAIADQAPQLLDTLGAVTLPVNKAGQTTRSFLGGWQLFVFSGGKNPQGGLDLLKWLYDPTFYTDYVERTRGAALPVTKAALSSSFFTADPIRSVLVKQMETAVRYGGPVYGTTPYMGEAEGKLLFSQALGDVMNGKRGVEEAVTFLERELKTLAGQ
ncbi:MAG: sugar ABC transporter substrate-binding protein [Chloroflexi bacterium]|nr:sugar ABC transporter substrate-binding protein [Chloroflexota bacterium]